VGGMDATTASKLCDATGPRRVRVELGLQRLAFFTLCNAIEDAAGRYADTRVARRRQAANAIRWLRRAGQGDLRPFQIDWVAHILDTDAKRLAQHGVARLPAGGLKNWRVWRVHRDDDRRRVTQRTPRPCDYCGKVFTPSSNKGQRCCSSRCAGFRTSARNRARQEQAAQGTEASAVVDRYGHYIAFCRNLGVSPAGESWWRCLAG